MTGDQPSRVVRLGEAMRDARSAAGMSVIDAAERAGMSRSQWTRFESGDAQNPREQTLASIEQVFKWRRGSIRAFLRGDGEAPEPQGVVDLSVPGSRGKLLADIRRELKNPEEAKALRRDLLRLLADVDVDSE